MTMRLEDAPDALLAQRAQDGDDRAFAVLVRTGLYPAEQPAIPWREQERRDEVTL